MTSGSAVVEECWNMMCYFEEMPCPGHLFMMSLSLLGLGRKLVQVKEKGKRSSGFNDDI